MCIRDRDILSSYPDRDYASLRSTISEYCNIPAEFILPGNGSVSYTHLDVYKRQDLPSPSHSLLFPHP